MLTSERQRMIKEQALKVGEVSISDLARKYNVSIETIRRDINILSDKNLLKKVRGGAVPVRYSVREDAYDVRYRKNQAGKTAIGEYIASTLIEDNDNIALSDGSTMEILAASIINKHNLLIVTNSFNVATILKDRIRQNAFTGEVIMLGGVVRSEEHCTVGSIAIDTLKKFTFNKAFLGISALSGRDLMTSNIENGIVMSAMIDHSSFCCVAADSSKFDIRSTYTFADLSAIDAVVTEAGGEISDEVLSLFDSNNVKRYVAGGNQPIRN